MEIETTRFGTIKIEEEKIIHMPFGMLGFPDQNQFVIIQHKENSPLFWFQSLDEPALAFVITSPFLFEPSYNIDLDPVIKEMSWNGDGTDNHLELYIVVNIPKGSPQKMTGNFIGPILINNKVNQAVQVVVSDSIYTHNLPLLEQQEGSP